MVTKPAEKSANFARTVATIDLDVETRLRLTADEAADLAELLGNRRTAGARDLALRIREQTRRCVGLGEPAVDLRLEDAEFEPLLEELSAALELPGWAETSPGYVHLRCELAGRLAR